MDVELPSEGCNIINSATSFYNYRNNNRTRSLYYIYDGKARKASENTQQNAYIYTGECLVTGDLVYRPEYKEFIMPNVAILIFFMICLLVFRLLRGRR